MSRTAAVADHLENRAASIIAVWKAAVERGGDVPDARRLSHSEFVDHVPEILDRIAARLRGKRDGDLVPEGQKHGQVRWRQGYDIAEVIVELGYLRETLLGATFAHAREGNQDFLTLERASLAINDVLDEAAAESVRQFQEENLEQSRTMIREVEARKQTIDLERTKLKTVLNNLSVGVWVISSDGLIVGINREAERLQKFPASETVNHLNVHDPGEYYRLFNSTGRRLGPSDLPASRALAGEVVSQEEIFWEVDGEIRAITANAAPLYNADDSLAGCVVVAQDVTDRQLLKAELLASETRFRTIAEGSPVMIWRSDHQGERDYFNRTWLDFRGRSSEHEAGEGWLEGIHDDDRAECRETYHDALTNRSPFEKNYRLLRRDGVYRSVVDRGVPHFDQEGRFLGFLGSCLDITERVELETALEEQSKHKSRLMAALSHDARTPLNAVFLAAQLLETQVRDQDDPEVQESLRVIRDSVKNVLDLLSDLLDLTRIDAGAMPSEITSFALAPTLTECLSSIEPQARAKGLDVILDLDHTTGINLATDRNKLKQILANFLSNALRYTERGSIRLESERTPEHIKISVTDTGVGISPEDQPRIFDEFATLGQARRGSSEGTGLGLAICRRLATLLQGEILLESIPGTGSTFTLALPNRLITHKQLDIEEPVVSVSPDSGPILITEDHEPSRRALARILQRLGYRVLEAGDGHEAIAQARRERPFIILMDINMPGMDGIEATRQLRADPTTRDIPIFALTGDVTIVNQRRIGEAGVDGYLEKPVTWEQIERRDGASSRPVARKLLNSRRSVNSLIA